MPSQNAGNLISQRTLNFINLIHKKRSLFFNFFILRSQSSSFLSSDIQFFARSHCYFFLLFKRAINGQTLTFKKLYSSLLLPHTRFTISIKNLN